MGPAKLKGLSCTFVLEGLIGWILHYYYYIANTAHSLRLELCVVKHCKMCFSISLQMEPLKTALNSLEATAIIPQALKWA